MSCHGLVTLATFSKLTEGCRSNVDRMLRLEAL